jgi:hypothetical protein
VNFVDHTLTDQSSVIRRARRPDYEHVRLPPSAGQEVFLDRETGVPLNDDAAE